MSLLHMTTGKKVNQTMLAMEKIVFQFQTDYGMMSRARQRRTVTCAKKVFIVNFAGRDKYDISPLYIHGRH